MERDWMGGTQMPPKKFADWRRLVAEQDRARNLELLTRQNEEIHRWIEQRLSRREQENAPGRGSNSHEMPPHPQSAVADEHRQRTLQLRWDALEAMKQDLMKPAREQHVTQDKEVPAWLIPHDLEMEELTEPDDGDIKSNDTPELLGSAAAIQLRYGWSDEQMQQFALQTAHDTSASEDPVYDLFFAALSVFGDFVGIGCIIKDAYGQVVSENSKRIGVGISHHVAEYSALSIGLNIAEALGLRRINAYGNPGFIYLEVQRQVEAPWTVEQLAALEAQIKELDSFSLKCVKRAENWEATNLAKYAVEEAPRLKRKSSLQEETDKQCLICWDHVYPADVVSVNGCGHQFCFNCLSQHVDAEILRSKVPVRCPLFAYCNANLDENGCKRLLSPAAFDTYLTRLIEATIPDSEKVYCPFPSCSALHRRTNKNETKRERYAASSSTSTHGTTNRCRAECTKCHRLFCVECRVPWHTDLTCVQYQDLPPNESVAGDRQLFELAKDKKWMKCENCRRLISLAGGCFHIICRCGNEFCYLCGTNYQDKLKVCSCSVYGNDMQRQMIETYLLRRGQNPQERIPPQQWHLRAIESGRLEERYPEAPRIQYEPIPEERTPEARTRSITREMNDEANNQASIQQRTPEGRTFQGLFEHRAIPPPEQMIVGETSQEVRIRPSTLNTIAEAHFQARFRELEQKWEGGWEVQRAIAERGLAESFRRLKQKSFRKIRHARI